mmetsp:Transcript_16428/g.40208  ORF Transcript_16428/g.40208 Transcript_16428/m.40208 type:complete len:309 (-) Transcript_16428:5-931(-)
MDEVEMYARVLTASEVRDIREGDPPCAQGFHGDGYAYFPGQTDAHGPEKLHFSKLPACNDGPHTVRFRYLVSEGQGKAMALTVDDAVDDSGKKASATTVMFPTPVNYDADDTSTWAMTPPVLVDVHASSATAATNSRVVTLSTIDDDSELERGLPSSSSAEDDAEQQEQQEEEHAEVDEASKMARDVDSYDASLNDVGDGLITGRRHRALLENNRRRRVLLDSAPATTTRDDDDEEEQLTLDKRDYTNDPDEDDDDDESELGWGRKKKKKKKKHKDKGEEPEHTAAVGEKPKKKKKKSKSKDKDKQKE